LPPHPIVIGLLGGIAAGKSTVAAAFAARGFALLDADQEARAVTSEPAVVDAIAARFGPAAVAGGRVDRKALAVLVFHDPAARRDLEAITHPAVRARLERQLEAALARGQDVVLDVPLLLEGGLIARCDHCVFVDAAEPTRRARALARGWDDDELLRRERAQADLAVKRAHCAHTISTDGSLDDVRMQVDALLAQLGRARRP
jgi:dephospho-CoA kinase